MKQNCATLVSDTTHYRNQVIKLFNDENFSKLDKTNQLYALFLGLVTEVGEVGDEYKKSLFYNRHINRENLKEELGDVLYHLTLIAHVHDISIGEIQDANLKKLSTKFPERGIKL
jgi:NTP pyrophosphatase (non-canonical NTP hydrolase)